MMAARLGEWPWKGVYSVAAIAGFVLALGLLVDDSIVVVENISRYLRAGYSRVEAAIIRNAPPPLKRSHCTTVTGLLSLTLVASTRVS